MGFSRRVLGCGLGFGVIIMPEAPIWPMTQQYPILDCTQQQIPTKRFVFPRKPRHSGSSSFPSPPSIHPHHFPSPKCLFWFTFSRIDTQTRSSYINGPTPCFVVVVVDVMASPPRRVTRSQSRERETSIVKDVGQSSGGRMWTQSKRRMTGQSKYIPCLMTERVVGTHDVMPAEHHHITITTNTITPMLHP